jgi:hypothetical protein
MFAQHCEIFCFVTNLLSGTSSTFHSACQTCALHAHCMFTVRLFVYFVCPLFAFVRWDISCVEKSVNQDVRLSIARSALSSFDSTPEQQFTTVERIAVYIAL